MILKIREGKVKTIYDDSYLDFVRGIGEILITRATHVEFDNKIGKWVATTADLGENNIVKPGTIIAITDTRKEAIDREIEFLKCRL